MDEERSRILRMMAQGTISVEECDELLRSLTDRRKEKTEKEVQAAQHESRPIWPYILLVALAIFAVPASFAGFRLVPRFSGLIGIAGFIFWVWMIVDCLSRLPLDFKLLFTTEHKYEKWIWLGVVVLAFPVGAIVYFLIIRQPTPLIIPPLIREKFSSVTKSPAEPERPLRPARRARSIIWLVIVTILLAVSLPLGTITFLNLSKYTISWTNDEFAALAVISPISIIVLIWLIFWICMLISCLSRDYREFGTLITSDKSADKLVWVLLILFLPIIGAIAYHISIRRRPMAG